MTVATKTQIVRTDHHHQAKPPTVMEQLAEIPEEEIWLAKQKSARTRRAYRLDVRHFMATMPLPRTIDIDGRRYLWRDLVALRRAQAAPKQEQPTLFPLHEDCRPAGERSAAERYEAPSLFTVLECSNG
jgi:hypothetical protein